MEFVYTVLSVWRVLDPDERSVSLDDVSALVYNLHLIYIAYIIIPFFN